MINRIRDIRRAKRMTLADVAARCVPPTTAQTIGRLETGTRQLSLTWMNKIAKALEVDSELLVKGDAAAPPQYIARITEYGAEALTAPRDAIMPSELNAANVENGGTLVALAIEASAGDYRAGDQVWLRQYEPEHFAKLLNRDVLAPRSGGRFAFGRMFDRDASKIAILPPGANARQVVIDGPAWVAAAEMLVRKL